MRLMSYPPHVHAPHVHVPPALRPACQFDLWRERVASWLRTTSLMRDTGTVRESTKVTPLTLVLLLRFLLPLPPAAPSPVSPPPSSPISTHLPSPPLPICQLEAENMQRLDSLVQLLQRCSSVTELRLTDCVLSNTTLTCESPRLDPSMLDPSTAVACIALPAASLQQLAAARCARTSLAPARLAAARLANPDAASSPPAPPAAVCQLMKERLLSLDLSGTLGFDDTGLKALAAYCTKVTSALISQISSTHSLTLAPALGMIVQQDATPRSPLSIRQLCS